MAPAPRAPGTLVLLLPGRGRLAEGAPPLLAQVLARADALESGGSGSVAQLLRHFELVPRGLPVAALTRQLDCGDARYSAWLRADPAWVQADMGTGRLMACGDLELTPEECEALLRPLRPLFGDAGFPISAPRPDRWYLMLPEGARLPDFVDPDTALGGDLVRFLPQGPDATSWRRLLNEAQVTLHNHPHNAARRAAGKAPVNSLWFWGGGRLPSHLGCRFDAVGSNDPLLEALADCSQPQVEAIGSDAAIERALAGGGSVLADLRALRAPGPLAAEVVAPALLALRRGSLAALEFDFGDGLRRRYLKPHRWRVWRRGGLLA
ncbi:MAG TPA: phosphoglycerate mutase [Xanthomonadaceae bacterium]|nr:phosphoglycerate mutase [Xanthomonadaceae bacterium]